MASLRNLAIGILHAHGFRNIAAACVATPATPPESYHSSASQACEPVIPALCRDPGLLHNDDESEPWLVAADKRSGRHLSDRGL
jgi:hypothetical protein